MLGYHRIELWDVTLIVMVLLFILFGHRLPSLMRTGGHRVLAATQHLPAEERKAAIFAYLMLQILLVVLVVMMVGWLLLVLSAAPRSW